MKNARGLNECLNETERENSHPGFSGKKEPIFKARAGQDLREESFLGWGPLDTTCMITLNSLASAPQYRACTLTRVSGKDAIAEN